LGSAIASTILSYAAVSFVGVDKAQAAQLTFNFDLFGASGYLKVSNSSLRETGFYGFQETFVSEGRFYGYTFPELGSEKKYYDLAGARALFRTGEFLGFYASGSDSGIKEYIIPPDAPFGPLFLRFESFAYWEVTTTSAFLIKERWRRQVNYQSYIDDGSIVTQSYNRDDRLWVTDARVSYTLVNTEAEPVPEPLTAGGTALALAGLSWLKHKKKMAA
jgi:hypothetical protein